MAGHPERRNEKEGISPPKLRDTISFFSAGSGRRNGGRRLILPLRRRREKGRSPTVGEQRWGVLLPLSLEDKSVTSIQ